MKGGLWKIRKYSPGDEFEIITQLQKYSEIEINEWKWKYLSRQNSKTNIWIVENDNKIIGHLGLIGNKIVINRKTINGCQAVDLFIDKKYQRKGIFIDLGKTSLNAAGKEGISLAYGFPNKEALNGHLKYGWEQIGMLNKAFKPLNIEEYIEKKFTKNKLQRTIARPLLKFKSREKSLEKSSECIDTIDFFEDDLMNLNDMMIEKNFSFILRTNDYLNWRYCSNPQEDYVKLVAHDGNKIVGFIVGGIRKEKQSGYIVDFLVSPDDSNLLRRLIDSLITIFLEQKLIAVYTWIPNKLYSKAFKDSGFIFRAPTQPFIVRANTPEISQSGYGDYTKWFVTMGDSDLY